MQVKELEVLDGARLRATIEAMNEEDEALPLEEDPTGKVITVLVDTGAAVDNLYFALRQIYTGDLALSVGTLVWLYAHAVRAGRRYQHALDEEARLGL
ncbi:MAG: hypothetical protein KGL39_28825 [Patescibacteria group bacterium]|nr:hypothetical protein [Patescibacteria group bacterium]